MTKTSGMKIGPLALVATLVLPAPALAGPWARDPAEAFLSYTLSADSTQDAIADGSFDTRLYHSVYGEIGLGRRLTFGFDIGGDTDTGMGSAFVRYTFTRNAAPWQAAADLGLGWRDIDGAEAADLYRIGVSVGRGFQRRNLEWVPVFEPEDGWFQIDSYALIDPDGDQTLWQSEATFGMFLNDRFGAMLQVKAEEFPDAELAVTVSPNVLMRLGERSTAQLGARFGVSGSEEVGLRLGFWQSF